MSIERLELLNVRSENIEITIAWEPHTVVSRFEVGKAARIWINIDGVCRLRGYDCTLTINDERTTGGVRGRVAVAKPARLCNPKSPRTRKV